MQFVDKAFARRLESAEEMPQVYLAPLYQKQRPEIGAESKAVCGGHTIFAGLGSPVGRAVGLGLDRPFTAEALDEVEAFYRSHAAPSQVDLTPVHDPATFEMFKERGYGIAELNNVLWRPLGREEDFLGSGSASIRVVGIVGAQLGNLAPHLNLGYAARSAETENDAFLTTVGFDALVTPWATMAAELITEWQVGESKITLPGPIEFVTPFHRVKTSRLSA